VIPISVGVTWVTANRRISAYRGGALYLQEFPMTDVTEAELVEIVPDLLALAKVETSEAVRDALIRLADRYAAMADRLVPAIAA
jgi:hypothetical protein